MKTVKREFSLAEMQQVINTYLRTGSNETLDAIKGALRTFDISKDPIPFYYACSVTCHNQRKSELLNVFLDSVPQSSNFSNTRSADKVLPAGAFLEFGGGIIHWILNLQIIDGAEDLISDLLDKCIAKGAKLNERDCSGKTAFQWMAHYNFPSLITKLYKLEPSLAEISDKDGVFPEHEALFTNANSAFHAIVNMNSAIHKLPQKLFDKTNIKDFLDKNGFDASKINAFNPEIKFNPLFAAIKLLDQIIKAEPYLMQAKQEISAYKNILALLSHLELNIEETDFHGLSAIMFAAKCNLPVVVKLLIQKGANLFFKDNAGFNVVAWAVDSGQDTSELLDVLYSAAKDRGVESRLFNSIDKLGYNPLKWAILHRSTPVKVVQKLIKCGADIYLEQNGDSYLDMTITGTHSGVRLDQAKAFELQKFLISEYNLKFLKTAPAVIPHYEELEPLMKVADCLQQVVAPILLSFIVSNYDDIAEQYECSLMGTDRVEEGKESGD